MPEASGLGTHNRDTQGSQGRHVAPAWHRAKFMPFVTGHILWGKGLEELGHLHLACKESGSCWLWVTTEGHVGRAHSWAPQAKLVRVRGEGPGSLSPDQVWWE